MKQTKNSSSFSFITFKDTLKKNWIYSAIILLLLFMTSTFKFYLALRLNPLFDKDVGYAGANLHSISMLYYLLLLLIAIIMGILAFRYNHKKSSSLVMHSMPFTRKQLYTSNYTAGLVLSLGPVLLNCILALPPVMIIINKMEKLESKNFFSNNIVNESLSDFFSSPVTIPEVIHWIIMSLILVFLVYSILAFASTVTGSSLMQTITAILINIIVPVIFILALVFCSQFLYGYTISDYGPGTILNGYFSSYADMTNSTPALDSFSFTHPFFYLIKNVGSISVLFGIVCVAVGAVLSISGFFLYKHEKLERVGDLSTYNVNDYFVTFVMTFTLMSIAAFVPKVITDTIFGFFPILILSGIVFFFICLIVLKKTYKILNFKNFIGLGIFAVLVFVFLSFTVLDVSKYESRIPDISNIDSITINSQSLITQGYIRDVMEKGKELKLKDKDTIQSFLMFHEDAVEEKNKNKKIIKQIDKESKSEDVDFENIENIGNITFTYKIGNKKIARSYSLPQSFYSSNKSLEAVFTSDEFKRSSTFKDNFEGIISNMRCYEPDEEGKLLFSLNEKDANHLIKLIDQDYLNLSYEEMLDINDDKFNMQLDYDYSINNNVISESGNDFIDISSAYKNTIKWFKDNGYYDEMYKSYLNAREKEKMEE